MTTQHLTDGLIRSTIAQRAEASAEGDLRERILAATAAVSQRATWRVSLAQAANLGRRGGEPRLVVVGILLLLAALVVALVGSWIVRPAPASPGRIAYIAGGDLYVAGPDGASGSLVWDLAATEDIALRRLVWVDSSTVLLTTYAVQDGGLSVVDVGTGRHRLLDTGTLVGISPDHQQAATLLGERLRIIDIVSGDVVVEFTAPMREYLHDWSPDGRWLLGEMPGYIYKLDLRDGAISVIATGLCCGLSPHSPAWSPDGTRIVYVDYHLPPTDDAHPPSPDCGFRCGTLWSLPAAGGVPTRITPELGSELEPVFSPDGRWIAYLQEDSQGFFQRNDLVVVAADGTGRRVLTPSPDIPLIDPDPGLTRQLFAWDPDSGGLTYLSFGDLWHVTLDGVAERIETPPLSEFARQVVP